VVVPNPEDGDAVAVDSSGGGYGGVIIDQDDLKRLPFALLTRRTSTFLIWQAGMFLLVFVWRASIMYGS
jgi:hypothetical protein